MQQLRPSPIRRANALHAGAPFPLGLSERSDEAVRLTRSDIAMSKRPVHPDHAAEALVGAFLVEVLTTSLNELSAEGGDPHALLDRMEANFRKRFTKAVASAGQKEQHDAVRAGVVAKQRLDEALAATRKALAPRGANPASGAN